MSLNRVIFHVGSPKTGTSIIQSHLAQNREQLKNCGYFYPVTISSDGHLYKTYESHHLLTYSVADWKPFNKYSPQRFIDLCLQTCDANSLHTLLLSAENTYWLPKQIVAREKPSSIQYWEEKAQYMYKFRDLFKHMDVQIIVYVRRQDQWLESWYNQQIKNGNDLPDRIIEFAEHCEYLLDYKAYLTILSDIFGEKNIKVRVYEKEQLKNGLFADFANIAGLGNEDAFPLRFPARYNSQLLPSALKFLQICNKIDAAPDIKRRLRLAVRSVTKQFESQIVYKQQNLFNREDRQILLDRYEKDNQFIAKEFLGRDDGVLFMGPCSLDEENNEEDHQLNNDDAIRLIMGVMLSEMQYHSKSNALSEVLKTVNNFAYEFSEQYLQRVVNKWRDYSDRKLWNQQLWTYEQL